MEWIKKMEVMKYIKEIKNKMERLVTEWDVELERMLEMERTGKYQKIKVIGKIQEMKVELKRIELKWKEEIKDTKEMEKRRRYRT
ncbi:uncharacterized protein N7477_009742 [Penicillium maclennaniae]|uniref:uncharacterized protein n=1 Tax=Penicillium maclennaniae TaxID=1343394 RepID=UPI002541F478|nr:uncharacterized protein N7477_009742 [Penicillium maclennaniae]KAJ5662126.1 hypothetical protein N7477_009742 [Penicillium maclennaniae]